VAKKKTHVANLLAEAWTSETMVVIEEALQAHAEVLDVINRTRPDPETRAARETLLNVADEVEVAIRRRIFTESEEEEN